MQFTLSHRALWAASVLLLPINLHAQIAPDGKLTLSAAEARASAENRDVLMARQALDAARSDLTTAKVTPPPVLSVNSQSINTATLGHGSFWSQPIDTIVRLDQPLERGGKAEYRARVAEAGIQAAEQDEHDTARQQRVAVAQAYWDLKLAQEQVGLAQANLALSHDSSQAAQTRLAHGDLSKLEATRLVVEEGRAANELAQARAQLEQARNALSLLLSEDVSHQLTAVDPWPSESLLDNETDQQWLATRPEVLAAQSRVDQAQAALDLAQAQRKADVTVGVQIEHNPPVGNRLWGVGVSWPLGTESRQIGPEARALSAVSTAETLLEKTRAAALAERSRWRSTLIATQERLHRLQNDILPQAQAASKAADFARQQGALGLQDVLDARRALHAAELDTAAAHADLAKALANLGRFPNADQP